MHITLKSLLRESMELLYHATDVPKLLKILKSDALKFTYADASPAEIKFSKGYPFYLSTMREKFGGYARRNGSTVVLVLNGKAFERIRGTKMISMDYWEGLGAADLNLNHNEAEERILSNHQVFKNLKKYVLEIHVLLKRSYFDPRFESSKRSHDYINNIILPVIELSKNHGIPTHFYIEKSGEPSANYKTRNPEFRMQRKDQSLSPDQAKKFFEDFQSASEELSTFRKTASPEDVDGWVERTDRFLEKDTKQIKYLIDIIDHPEKYNDIDARHDLELENALRYFTSWNMDLLPHFSSLVGNMRDKHSDILQELAKCLRRNGYTKLEVALKDTSRIFNILYVVKSVWKVSSPAYKKLIDLKYGYAMKDLDEKSREQILELLKEFANQKELPEQVYKKISDIIRK